MKYALFDWDNTLRKNFSLISWVNFLQKKGLVDDTVSIKIGNHFQKYQKEEINHEIFVENICNEYVLSVSGKAVETFDMQVNEYINIIELNSVFSFAKPLINLMNENNIRPIIVSGAPKIFLQHIMNEFSVFEIFAFSPKIENGIYVNDIYECYGIKKEKIVAKLIELYKAKPIFAFGDSMSDFPILNSANYPFLVTNNNSINYNSYEIINANDDTYRILDCVKSKIQPSN